MNFINSKIPRNCPRFLIEARFVVFLLSGYHTHTHTHAYILKRSRAYTHTQTHRHTHTYTHKHTQWKRKAIVQRTET